AAIAALRKKNQIPVFSPQDYVKRGLLNLEQAAEKLEVSLASVSRESTSVKTLKTNPRKELCIMSLDSSIRGKSLMLHEVLLLSACLKGWCSRLSVKSHKENLCVFFA
ncbi:MAG: hypothetical protein ACREOO_00210, partial [bacterium]